MNLETIRENGRRVILEFSIPAIISMILTSCVTLADGFFIGNYIGKEGLAAVNLGLPVVYLYLGIGLMVAIGGAAMSGMALGAGDKTACSRVFSQTMAAVAVCSVSVSVCMFFAFPSMLRFLRADGTVGQCFREYYGIMLLELPVMVVNSSLGMFVRGDGNPKFFMKTSMLNVGLNIVLDGLAAGVLGMGIGGIAAASLISALASFVILLRYFLYRGQREAAYRFVRFRFSWGMFKETVLNGSSEFIGEMSMSVAMFAYNFVIMRRFGVDGVTAFTVVGYVSYVFSMVVVGFGQGVSPVISFVFGAGERELAADLRRRANKYVFVSGLLFFLGMTACSGWYSRMFVRSEAVRELIGPGMRIFMISFFFSGINSITSFYFTATGRAFESAVISSSRGLVVLLFNIFVLPAVFGINGVWLAAPVTEAVTMGFTVFFLGRERG